MNEILLPFLASFLGALPIGMLDLGILLLIRHRTGSIAEAAAITGTFGAGNAVGLMVQGRLIDRRGQGVVLVPAALLCGAALLALVVTRATGIPVGLCALAGGLSLPATITSMRALTPQLLPDERVRATGYAMLAVFFSVAAVLGSLVVAGLLSLVGPAGAVLTAAALATAAGLAFAATPASRSWQPRPRIAGEPLGPLLGPGMRTLLIGVAVTGFTGGVSSIGIPAIALKHGVLALAALLGAAFSVGDLLVDLNYGAHTWTAPRSRHLVLGMSASAILAFAVAASVGSIPLLFVLEFLSGAASAPAGICTSALLDTVARPHALAQSYATLVCVGLLSSSAGNAVGGVLVGAVGIQALFVVSGCGVGAVAAWMLLRRHTLAERQLLTST